ncbi:MAG TPA: Ni/Fe hydrogenase subunit alpha [candidate division Zixibacteria bacterium]|nr:Ni/Fe hydrogenase subunit alpha [candidate division Zixibacteria bacterium]
MDRQINVDYLARVEGEGALRIKIVEDEIGDIQLNIFEPPRFFEGFLMGRGYQETVDITARICGICPVAYQMSAAHALEKALQIQPPPEVRALRRLLYLGEWIESHGLHVYMLHAPDFVGYDSAISMAGDPELRPLVEQGLRMKKIGNQLMTIIGGREIHPVSVCVGGFYRAPKKPELLALRQDLEWGLGAAINTVRWAAELEYPEFETEYDFVSMSHPDEYPINEGNIVSSSGLSIDMASYEEYFIEKHIAHSNALHSGFSGSDSSYFVGPLARVNLNFDKLSPLAQKAAKKVGFSPPEYNPFKSLIARSLELVHSFEESLQLIDDYQQPRPSRTLAPDALTPGRGAHATEAPRGLLYHRYEVDEEGLIASAKIVAPTSQNLKRMEDDLWAYAPGVLSLPLEEATLRCEQLVRSYDPCISCATHFLKLEIERV